MADTATKTTSKVVLGKKIDMTQVFTEGGTVTPVTRVSVVPQKVGMVRNDEKDGFRAYQITSDIATREINGKKYGVDEMPTEGDSITAEIFSEGDAVHVKGVTKGKGFQGGVKRHGFHGGPRSHGQKHSEREIGSIGGGGRFGGRVVKGKKMPGRMGTDNVTVKNLSIVKVDKDEQILYVKGALPGSRDSLVIVYAAK
jgi:large subunit ribosomal protein L3